jgi:hypothetical protein
VLGLITWLAIGVLTARLFGAFVSGSRHWWERDEDDQELTTGGNA